MNGLNNLDEIFAPKNAIKEPEQAKMLMYNPSAKNSKNGKYTACIRFVPWYKDPANSIVIKQQAYLKDPLTGKGRYIDSKRTVNEQCPIADAFWNLYNTKNAALMDFAKANISLNTTYTALVQIISDEQHPELNGKILPWRFGKTIWDKLYNEQHPTMGIAYNPFDIINGRYFAINVIQKGGWNNYDNCGFFDYRGQNGETSGMLYLNNGRYEIATANSDRQTIYDFLVNNTPDFSAYAYKPWTAEDNAYVNNVLQTITNYANTGSYGQNVNMAMSTAASAPVMNTPQTTMPQHQMNAVPQMPQMNASPVMPQMNEGAPYSTAQMPSMPQMNAAPQMNASPVMPQISGIDLPDVGMDAGMPQMNAQVTPVNMGMGLDDLYGNL